MNMDVRTTKRVFLFATIACLCLAAWGGAAPGEAAATEKATLKSAEELFQAGKDACEAKGYGVAQDYEKAAEYYRKPAELGSEEAAEQLKKLAEEGHIKAEQ